MIELVKPKNYWTKEKCREEALKYKCIKDFRTKSIRAYYNSRINNWLIDICPYYIVSSNKPMNYWTKEKCTEEALKYNTRRDFRNNSNNVYNACTHYGWLDEVCNHLPGWKPKNYWTKEKCGEEALKYNSRHEFELGNTSAYLTSRRNNWLDEIGSHMIVCGNKYKRCIYAIEFIDNHVYIGLTYNFDKRIKDHFKDKSTNKSSAFLHFKETNSSYEVKQITDYLEKEEAVKMEDSILKSYIDKNWIPLNKAKCGSLGGNNLIWDFEKCKEEALKYKSRREFGVNSSSGYTSARINGWLDEICQHMEILIRKDYWNKELCLEEALKYKTRTEFIKNSKGAFAFAKKHGWLDDMYFHMNKVKNPNGFWSKKICLDEALKYKTRKELQLNNSACYSAIKNNKWAKEAYYHMN